MAFNIILLLLFVSGLIGWILFFFTVTKFFCGRREEIKIITEIGNDIKKVKEELEQLK